MTLSDYVAALAGDLRVGPFRRRRILVEVEDHLRASVDERLAFGVPRDEAEEAALARFGPFEDLAAGFNRQWRVRTRLAAAAVLGGAGVLFVSVQRLMENWVQPAPWPEDAAPAAVAWQSSTAEACLLGAVVLALVALAGQRWSAAAAGLALVALALAAAFISHYDVERAALVAGSPTNWELAGVCALRAGALVPAALLVAGRLRVPRVLLT
jgi:hypothetical protein